MSAPTTMQWIRQALHQVAAGSGRLAAHLSARAIITARRIWRRVTGWLGESSGVSWLLRLAVLLAAAALLRKIVITVTTTVYERVHAGAAPWLLWGAALVWVVASYRCGRDDWRPDAEAAPAAAEPEREDQEQQPAVEPAPTGPPLVPPVALIAAVRDIGTPHAQLKPLAEHLGTTTDAVRAAAAALGWPVKDVRMAGRSSTAGLRWDEAPSPAPPPLPPGVVGAGQPTDDNDDDTNGEEPGEGVRAVRKEGGWRLYDLADVARRRGRVGH
ncbi:hypothetical protein ABZ322_37710 [Streptomyces sp. NPDC006129]|uniref:hypothetical protein n=1 Tax=Streptomyces sp. NPDC006129 TaxID=3155348 RepID=UPI0033AC3363